MSVLIVRAAARDIRSVRVQAARIQRVDQHAGANRPVHDLGLLRRVLRQGHESAGDQDDRALPRHRGHAANQLLDHAHGEPCLVIAEVQFLLRGLLRHLLCAVVDVGSRLAHAMASSVAAFSTVAIVLVHDHVRHVVRHVGAAIGALPGDRPHAQFTQRLVQQLLVVGEILNRLPRRRVDRGAIGSVQRAVDVPAGGVPRVRQVAELHVHVVEQVRDETVRQVGRGLILRRLVLAGGRRRPL